MNVPSATSAASTYQPTPTNPAAQEFQSLQNALQSGDLTGAQSAFSDFQQSIQNSASSTSANALFSQGSQTSKDLQTLGDALQSGDVSAAQKAFSTLKQDMKSALKTGHAHHHHHGGGNSTVTSAASTPAPADETSPTDGSLNVTA